MVYLFKVEPSFFLVNVTEANWSWNHYSDMHIFTSHSNWRHFPYPTTHSILDLAMIDILRGQQFQLNDHAQNLVVSCL